MNDTFFAGSYGGDNAKIGPMSQLECKICWHVYDPAEGDDCWQISPGTPFAELPAHWSCPTCDGSKQGFMVVGD
ncbi:rubredoxin [Allomesorhizobium camelthorni]|uniref:Rubredoxin n=1 Tax=Allomesorhizobium camelthorni TaxID=475069 RepID=A0A6G4WIR0_9HYPH|nr:rubredoxin [Mesorhizobium camelthorni]